jgi:type II secretory pathway component PulJ
MKYRSEKNTRWLGAGPAGFTFVEVVAALIILTIMTSSVLLVVNRCLKATSDETLRMRAFEIARENMEKLLAADTVQETFEQGTDEVNPAIQWQTVVEPFYEPATARMWMRAVCSATYTDWHDEPQTVEFAHWLTDVTKEQMLNIIQRKDQEFKSRLTEQQIQQFVQDHIDGVPTDYLLQMYNEITNQQKSLEEITDPGEIRNYILNYLKDGHEELYADLYEQIPQKQPSDKDTSLTSQDKLIFGYSLEQLKAMSLEQLWIAYTNPEQSQDPNL